MLTYSLQERGNCSLYEYLYRCIREDIAAGRLKPGEKLPSRRTLARHLGVSPVTVDNAYAQLVAEGYVRPAAKQGYYVARLLPAAGHPPVRRGQGAGSRGEEPWFMDFVTNRVGKDCFPFGVWFRLMRKTLAGQDGTLLQAAPAEGAWELRQAIGEYLYRFRGMAVDAEQIVVGAGTEYLSNLLVQLLGRDKVYAVEDPGYEKTEKIYALNGARVCRVPLDESGLRVDALEASGADVAHISPSHQFPTGIVTPVARRQALLQWAREGAGRYLVEDDYDSELRLTGRPIPTLQSIDRGERVIYLNTFSKSIAPSVRVSYMVLPGELMERYREKLGFYSATVPGFDQLTLAAFIREGHLERHIGRAKKLYRDKRDQVIAAFRASAFRDRITILERDAGLHFLVRLDTDLPDGEITRRAAEAGVRLNCLSRYGTAPAHQLVINYSGIDCARLGETMARLEQALL